MDGQVQFIVFIRTRQRDGRYSSHLNAEWDLYHTLLDSITSVLEKLSQGGYTVEVHKRCQRLFEVYQHSAVPTQDHRHHSSLRLQIT